VARCHVGCELRNLKNALDAFSHRWRQAEAGRGSTGGLAVAFPRLLVDDSHCDEGIEVTAKCLAAGECARREVCGSCIIHLAKRAEDMEPHGIRHDVQPARCPIRNRAGFVNRPYDHRRNLSVLNRNSGFPPPTVRP
jgi:hypothetical protein